MSESYNQDPLNAKERRKLKREEKKKMEDERTVLLEKLKPLPPAERISIYSNKFPSSTEIQWNYYDPVGWVHNNEDYDFKRSFQQCSLKKTWHPSGSMHSTTTGEGKVICEEAIKELGMVICEYSGYAVPKDEAVEVYYEKNRKGLAWIPHVKDAFNECDFTLRIYPKTQIIRVHGSTKYNFVSRWVIDGKAFHQCADCEKYYEGSMVMPRVGVTSARICSACHDIRTLGQLIHPHNYNQYPSPLTSERTIKRIVGGEPREDGPWKYFIGARKVKAVADPQLRLFGVEAETEIHRKGAQAAGLNRSRIAKGVLDAMGRDFIIIKEDGTLTANEHYSKGTGFSGFEIVTCPASLGVHRERWEKIVKADGYKHLRAWDEYDTCGLHIHVSRNCLSDLTIGKMLMFINHKNNAKFIFKVAGRGSERFCRYIPKEPGDRTHPATDVYHTESRVVNKEEDDRRNRSRRVALNLANKATVEFRIFRGTIHPRHVVRNIEFCDAVCDYCAPGDRSIQDMADHKKFIAFVNINRKKWPMLAEWMANQKIIALKQMSAKANRDKATLKPDESVEVEVGERPKKEETATNDIISMISAGAQQYWPATPTVQTKPLFISSLQVKKANGLKLSQPQNPFMDGDMPLTPSKFAFPKEEPPDEEESEKDPLF